MSVHSDTNSDSNTNYGVVPPSHPYTIKQLILIVYLEIVLSGPIG